MAALSAHGNTTVQFAAGPDISQGTHSKQTSTAAAVLYYRTAAVALQTCHTSYMDSNLAAA